MMNFDPSIPLNDELKPYIINENGMTNLKHPLVYHIIYAPALNDLINKQFEFKKSELTKALNKKNWGYYVFLHERPYRFNAFIEIMDELSDKKYWKLLRDVYIDSENIWQNKDELINLFSSNRTGKINLMDINEKKQLKSLPEKVEIYRGCQSKNKNGFSWTLEKDIAVWFANRFKKNKNKAKLLVGQCDKTNIVAIFFSRNEKEVVIDPKNVKVISELDCQ